MAELPTFSMDAFYDALDERRAAEDRGWYDLAARLWDQSALLNVTRQWLRRPAADFIGAVAW